MGRTVDTTAAIQQQLDEIAIAIDAIKLLLLEDTTTPPSWEEKLAKKEQ